MALSLTIAGVDRVANLQHGSMRLSTTADGHQGVLDFTLVDFKPADNDTVVVADGATTFYDGNVRSITVDEVKVGHYFCGVACQDDAVAFGSLGAAPWELSDTPNLTTTFPYLSLKMTTASPNSAGTSTTGTITTRKAGLAAGQQLTVTSANHGLSAVSFNIVSLAVTWDIDGTPLYTATIGDAPFKMVDAIQTVVDSSVTAAAEALALSLQSPKVVITLPDLPNGLYPEGTLAYLTTDGKIYRSLGTSWSKSVDGADLLVASITAGAIQAGAIGAQALASEIVLASLIKTSNGTNRLELDQNGLRAYYEDVLTAEIGPEGVTAESLRIGNLAGGHNLIKNSSFELGEFVAASTSVTFTNNSGTPGWKAGNRTTAPDNVTEGATELTTTLAY